MRRMQLTTSSKCKFLPQNILGVEAIIEKKTEESHDFRGDLEFHIQLECIRS